MKTRFDEDTFLDRGGKPTLRELLRQLMFNPTDGSIKLNDARLVLQRASYNAYLRDELVRSYGKHDARVILTRLGFKAGTEDAKFIRKSWPHLDIGDAFTAGTRLHNMNGVVRVETVHNDFDFKKGKYSGSFLWHDGVEATEYLRNHGLSTEPVCWTQLGYASGYATQFFSNLIVFKEVHCAATGHPHCEVVGRAARTWGEDDELVRIYRNEIVEMSRIYPSVRRSDATRTDAEPGSRPTVVDILLAPVREHLDRVALTDIPMFIGGPRGSGKTAAARYLHAATAAAEASFKRLSCAEADVDVIDHLLVKGAKAKVPDHGPHAGSAGTLVLEDVEMLGTGAQLRLTEYLDGNAVSVNGSPPVRLIATSTRSLSDLIGLSAVRRDLLHRLAIMPLAMPQLSQRHDDLPKLASAILERTARRLGRPVPRLTATALNYVTEYDWPGNLPELEAQLLAALLLVDDNDAIDACDLEARRLPQSQEGHGSPGNATLDTCLDGELAKGNFSLDRLNQRIYDMALNMAKGNVSSAARMLGVTRAQLAYRLQQSGVSEDSAR